MAHSKELWEKAKGYYEAGLSLSKINDKTGIDRSAISKKAKNQQWQQGKNIDYIEAKEVIAVKKSTENQQALICADEIADDNIRRKNLVHGLTEKILNNINKSVSQKITVKDDDGKEIEEEILLDSKSAKEYIEAVDKASVTLGVNQRHANSQINVQTNTQVNSTTILSEEEAKKKALDLGVPLEALMS